MSNCCTHETMLGAMNMIRAFKISILTRGEIVATVTFLFCFDVFVKITIMPTHLSLDVASNFE